VACGWVDGCKRGENVSSFSQGAFVIETDVFGLLPQITNWQTNITGFVWASSLEISKQQLLLQMLTILHFTKFTDTIFDFGQISVIV